MASGGFILTLCLTYSLRAQLLTSRYQAPFHLCYKKNVLKKESKVTPQIRPFPNRLWFMLPCFLAT